MANELERRYGHKGLHGLSIHPGVVHTNIPRHLGSEFVEQLMKDENILKILSTSEQGAAMTVLAAVGKEWEGKGGKYLEYCEEGKRGIDYNDAFGVGYVRQTYDPSNEERPWKDSLKIVGMSDDM
jgi:hypothetical protein